MKKKMKMKSWIARMVAVSVLLIALGMVSLAQEDATILPPANVNVTVENDNENATIEVVPLTNTRQVLALSGTDPSIFDRKIQGANSGLKAGVSPYVIYK